MRFPGLLMLLTVPCVAQTPHIYVDLSGPWTRVDPGRPPRAFALPRTMLTTDEPFHLERDITLPDSGLTGIALLMTPLGGSFEVKVNGQTIGGLKSSHPSIAPPTRSVVLPVPDGLLHAGSNRLSVDVGAIRVADRLTTSVPPGGPLLGGAAELSAIADGRERAYQLRRVYMPVDTVAQFLYCAILIWLSRGSRYRKAMLWMAFYFGAVVFGFDLFYTLDVFAGLSRTPRDWLAPLNFLIWMVAPFETSLALLEYAPPLWSRVFAYTLLSLMTALTRSPGAYLILGINTLLLVLAIRRGNRIAAGFQWLMVGYNLVTIAVIPPLSLPQLIPIGPLAIHLVPGYRIVIGIGLILIVIRQSARDRNERERLAGELSAARTVQQLLFPASTARNIEAVYRPAAEVGGDFWQALAAADGGQIVAVGDVSGKGLKAAMVVSLLTGALRNRKSDHPAAILEELNRVAASALDGGFVTAAVARIGPARVTIANAGHPAPYSNGKELALDAGLPLGIEANATYSEREIEFDGQLTFVSDGVIEAANAKGELFGFDRTRAISSKPPAEIAEAARAWGQNDDITVVTVRRAP